jgi:putative transposase
MNRLYQKSTKKPSPDAPVGRMHPVLNDVVTTRQAASQLVQLASRHGQFFLPMTKLMEQARVSVTDVIAQLGTVLVEFLLDVSATEVAGLPHQGKCTGSGVTRHGHQRGIVTLADRKITVNKPRLRRSGGGPNAEVEIPIYTAMQNGSELQEHILEATMRGVTTRNYAHILPEACVAVGISKSSVSRKFIQASEQECRALLCRSLGGKQFPVIFIDGIGFGGHHVIAAVGIDHEGKKQILGLREGETENATVVRDLLEDIISRGLSTGVKRLFVIDGSKALRAAIREVFGTEAAVQRCRVHKMRNVLDHLPKEDRGRAKTAMQAAFRVGYKEGKRKLLKLADQFESEHPSAAASVREGLAELFTVQELGVPKSLAKCLVNTNIIESANSGVRTRTNRVVDWQDGAMAIRWAAAAFGAAESAFRRVSGHGEIGSLISALEKDRAAEAA